SRFARTAADEGVARVAAIGAPYHPQRGLREVGAQQRTRALELAQPVHARTQHALAVDRVGHGGDAGGGDQAEQRQRNHHLEQGEAAVPAHGAGGRARTGGTRASSRGDMAHCGTLRNSDTSAATRCPPGGDTLMSTRSSAGSAVGVVRRLQRQARPPASSLPAASPASARRSSVAASTATLSATTAASTRSSMATAVRVLSP